MKTALTALALGTALALTGCSSDSQPGAPAPRDFYASTAPEVPSPTDEQVGLAVLRDQIPGLMYVPDSQINDTARVACTRLDEGHTVEDLISLFTSDPSLNHKMAGALLAYAVVVHCPEYSAQIEAL